MNTKELRDSVEQLIADEEYYVIPGKVAFCLVTTIHGCLFAGSACYVRVGEEPFSEEEAKQAARDWCVQQLFSLEAYAQMRREKPENDQETNGPETHGPETSTTDAEFHEYRNPDEVS